MIDKFMGPVTRIWRQSEEILISFEPIHTEFLPPTSTFRTIKGPPQLGPVCQLRRVLCKVIGEGVVEKIPEAVEMELRVLDGEITALSEIYEKTLQALRKSDGGSMRAL